MGKERNMLVKIIGGHGGTSPGFRTTSYLIDGVLLLDAGSVASGIPIEEQVKIKNILISHSHLDHISDLAFMADNCFGLKSEPFEVFANTSIHKAIKDHLLNDIIWPDFSKLPSVEHPTLRFHNLIPEKWIEIGEYRIFPVPVNHPNGALGFIIERDEVSIVFTQDTAETELIWQHAKKAKNLKAIFTEVSFPNALSKVARDSQHHTPATMNEEIQKMPKDIPIFLGHLKPNYEKQLFYEIKALGNERLQILGSVNKEYTFNP